MSQHTIISRRSTAAIADAGRMANARRGARLRRNDRAAAWPELGLLEDIGRVQRVGAYRLRRIEDPACALGPARAAALRGMCGRASSLSFGVDMTPYWRSRPGYFSEIAEWSVADRQGELAGWHGIALWRGDCGTVLYNDMLVTLPAHRGTGLGALLAHDGWVRAAVRTLSLPIVACRTQNPIVMRMLTRFTTTTYPRLDGRPDGPLHARAVQVARLVADHKGTGTAPTPGTFVGRGAFPGALCDPLPACHDPGIDAFFACRLDPAAGDAVYAIGVMSPAGGVRAFARYNALRAQLALAGRRGRKEATR